MMSGDRVLRDAGLQAEAFAGRSGLRKERPSARRSRRESAETSVRPNRTESAFEARQAGHRPDQFILAVAGHAGDADDLSGVDGQVEIRQRDAARASLTAIDVTVSATSPGTPARAVGRARISPIIISASLGLSASARECCP